MGDPAHLLGGRPGGRVADDGGEEGGVHLGVVEAGDEEEEVLAERLEDGVAHQLRQQVHPPRRRQELAPAQQVEQKLRGANASNMPVLITFVGMIFSLISRILIHSCQRNLLNLYFALYLFG